jgi:chromosome partitioning protein
LFTSILINLCNKEVYDPTKVATIFIIYATTYLTSTDTDPQESATFWGNNRQVQTPIVATATPSQLTEVLAAAKAEEVTLVVLDSAPHSSPNASEIARLADFVVIPTRASAFDLAALESTVKIIKAVKKPFGFVLNAID